MPVVGRKILSFGSVFGVSYIDELSPFHEEYSHNL
jgi:hypothetical protein